jgi:hypothetical protein
MLIQLSTARFLASEAMRPCVLVVDDETIICELLGLGPVRELSNRVAALNVPDSRRTRWTISSWDD